MSLLKIVTAVLISTNVFAFPVGNINSLNTNPKEILKLDETYDFNGIVKLSNCSGAIIKFVGMSDSSNAIVMTNGHCTGGTFGGMIDPGKIIYQKDVSRAMKVYNKDTALVGIKATKILYATMTGTDVALYELKETYTDLLNKGVNYFTLTNSHPTLGTSIDVVSGYWDRGYRCNIDSFIHELREANWVMTDSIKYTNTGCHTIGGTSGSPIIQTGTRDVIGINNTMNQDGKKCTMNNPCEVDQDGNITVSSQAAYGQETYQIYSCLTSNFKIDLKISGCELFK